MLKRRTMGRQDGVALIAEGVAERLDPKELQSLPGVVVEYDPYGHLELREIPLANVLKRLVQERFASRGDKTTIIDVTLGYELRCAPPIPFDCEYVRDLGWGAVNYLLSDSYNGAAIICLEGGRTRPLKLGQIMDPKTGRTQVRLVDVNTEYYRVAREYMIRLGEGDFTEPVQLEALANAASMTSEEFLDRFGSGERFAMPVPGSA